MAAHQRAQTVTVLAVTMHVLTRYSSCCGDVDRKSESSWAEAWNELIGPDALRITAPHGEAAFLQPPTREPRLDKDGELKDRQLIEEADLLVAKVQHEVKCTWSTARAETAIFSLIGGLSRPYTNFYLTSTRIGLCAVLPSTDGTIGSEISALVSAYDQLNLPANSAKAADHFVWLRPYRPRNDQGEADAPISFADLPRPFLDIGRAQRIIPLYQQGDAGYGIWACPNNTIRVTGADPWLDDPHTPKTTSADGTRRYKLAAKTFDHRFQHHVLFGSVEKQSTIERPRILDLADYQCVRVCALGTEQGKTRGYHEALYAATRSEGLFHLNPPKPEDRPARLSASALATIDAGSKVLYAALAVLYPDAGGLNDAERSRIKVAQAAYHQAAGHASVQLVFDLLNSPENVEIEQQRFDAMAAVEVRRAFSLATTALLRPLHAARAEQRLEAGIRSKLHGESMSREFEPPMLARQSFAILRDLTEHANPNDRAQLRTMSLPEPPLSFWKMLARVPQEQIDNEHCLEIWKRILKALGDIRHSGASLGRALAIQDFPEHRMDRLLTASGASLPGLIDEALRWLVSHRVEHADLSVLATLGIADGLGDAEARDWSRRQIALAYVRSKQAQMQEAS
jgi:hypothetical protein